jgi:CrcB protein
MPAVDRRELAAIFAGGAAGALLRVWLVRRFPTAPGSWPWVTFAVNVAGSLVLGYVVTRLQERLPVSTYRRPLLGTGFCGAFTTFSTAAVEAVRRAQAGRWGAAAATAGAHLGVSLLAVAAGLALAGALRG